MFAVKATGRCAITAINGCRSGRVPYSCFAPDPRGLSTSCSTKRMKTPSVFFCDVIQYVRLMLQSICARNGGFVPCVLVLRGILTTARRQRERFRKEQTP